jgi:hypothetical protein
MPVRCQLSHFTRRAFLDRAAIASADERIVINQQTDAVGMLIG